MMSILSFPPNVFGTATSRLQRFVRLRPTTCLLFCVVVVGAGGIGQHVRGADLESVIAAGKDLFEREWSPASPGGSVAAGGDGLGPAFNDRSCVACHRQGGVGGGGPLDKNVDMLNLPSDELELSLAQARQLRQLHPGFLHLEADLNSSIVLHKFMLDKSYAAARRQLLGDEPAIEPHPALSEIAQHRFAAAPIQTVATSFDVTLIRAQRNTSALFGGGLIDQIPDAVLLALEKSQPTAFPGITGRAAPASDGIGRFGWRAKTARLSEFVLQACANEVGLQVVGTAQGMVPSKPDYRSPGLDLTPDESTALVAFVTALPPPRQVLPTNPEALELVASGRNLFAQVGCAACHLESLGSITGLYSDLLLHDMGPGLADPAPAQPDTALLVQRITQAGIPRKTGTRPQTRTQTQLIVPDKQTMASSGQAIEKGKQATVTNTTPSYYGGTVVQSFKTSANEKVKVLKLPTMIYQEWRTPPLWGVQDSAPYLHDGRAATLVEAIAWHGGEAQPATQRYFALPAAERLKVIAFLRTLRAPVF
jgi:mono/diheme cytochrome c family protein